jgi:hypothetical protein
MSLKTQVDALKELASILASILRLYTRLINFHRSIPSGSLRYCNHTHHDGFPSYHESMTIYVQDQHDQTKQILDHVQQEISKLPEYDVWTDPVEGPILRYMMTMHDGVQFEHYASEHHHGHEFADPSVSSMPSLINNFTSTNQVSSASTAPAEESTIFMIQAAKTFKESARFLFSTRLSKTMWLGEDEAQFEESMNDHCMQLAREEEKMQVCSLMSYWKVM